MAQQPTVSDSGVTRGSSIAASAGLGVLAAAIGYLLTYLLIGSEVRDIFGDSVADWKGVAWYFYNAHLVDIESTGSIDIFGGIGGSSTVDFIAQSSSTSASVLYVIPPLVLLGTGAYLALQFETTEIGEAVTVGVPVTIGYALVATLGAVAAEASAEGIIMSGSMSPDLIPAVVLAGVLYPLVFATAGAILAAVVAPE